MYILTRKQVDGMAQLVEFEEENDYRVLFVGDW